MLDVISADDDIFRLRVNPTLVQRLEEHSFFQFRCREQQFPHSHDRWKIGNYLTLRKDCRIEPYVVLGAGYNLFSMGAFTDVISPFPPTWRMGRYVSVAKNCEVLGGRHPLDSAIMSSISYSDEKEIFRAFRADHEAAGGIVNFRARPTPQPGDAGGGYFGHDVWVCQDVRLKDGVSIGNGAVIGARSLVLKDVPAYAVVGGNPARFIRWRFPPEVIELLEASRWWEFSPAQLHEFDIADPRRFACEILDNRAALVPFEPPLLDLWDEVQRQRG